MAADDIKIVGFDAAYADAFAKLNYEWIEKSYAIEPHDREILDHPVEHIIEPGGEIFFAMLDNEAVGTVALIESSANAFELAKMAVTPGLQGRGVGKQLMQACIDHARKTGKSEIILESNTKQEAAIHMYRAFDFEETELDPRSQYSRANIRMRLAIQPPSV